MLLLYSSNDMYSGIKQLVASALSLEKNHIQLLYCLMFRSLESVRYSPEPKL